MQLMVEPQPVAQLSTVPLEPILPIPTSVASLPVEGLPDLPVEDLEPILDKALAPVPAMSMETSEAALDFISLDPPEVYTFSAHTHLDAVRQENFDEHSL